MFPLVWYCVYHFLCCYEIIFRAIVKISKIKGGSLMDDNSLIGVEQGACEGKSVNSDLL